MIAAAMLAKTIREYFRIHEKEFEEFVIAKWKDKEDIDFCRFVDGSGTSTEKCLTIRIVKDDAVGGGPLSEYDFEITIEKKRIA